MFVEYEVLQAVRFATGLLKLSKDQAKRRAHNLKYVSGKEGEAIYKIVNPVQFKIGEKVFYAGEVSRGMDKFIKSTKEVKEERKKEKEQPFEEMSKDELIAACIKRKIDPPDRANKTELMKILKKAK